MNNNCLRNYNIDEFSPIQKGIFEIGQGDDRGNC